MNDFNDSAPVVPQNDIATPESPREQESIQLFDTAQPEGETPEVMEEAPPPVNPVRAAAGRLGGQRVHQLAELGREYEKEHGLSAGRQRLKQLIQLGRRYEVEHGLATAKPRRKRRGDAWSEFLTALSRVVKPSMRPAVEQLVAAVRNPQTTERRAA